MHTVAKKKRERKKPEVRRRELLDAASRLFVEKGYKSTSVDDIVAAAGASKGTFYLYFESKPAVLNAIVEQVQTGIFEVLGEVMTSDLDPEEKLYQGLERAFKKYEQNEEIVRVFELAGPEAAHERLRSRGWEASKPVVGELLREGMKQGLFRIEDFDGTVDLVMAIVADLQHIVVSPYSKVTADSGMKLLRKAFDGLLK
jgi:AcrR family transcriptional regulator